MTSENLTISNGILYDSGSPIESMVLISSVATALIIVVIVFIIAIVTVLKRNKARIEDALELQQINGAERSSTHTESMYEEVMGASSLVDAINMQDNVAYGHTK